MGVQKYFLKFLILNTLFILNNMMNSSSKLIIGFISFPQGEIAKKVAKILVQEKIVACTKIISGIESLYMWEGKLQEDNEIYLMIKSNEEKVELIKKVLDKEHPYKIYEFLYHPVESGNSKYKEWLEESLSVNVGEKIDNPSSEITKVNPLI